MEKLKIFIREYEDIILNEKKIGKKPLKLYLMSILVFILLGGLTFLIGYLLDWLYQINYLFIMTNVVVAASYVSYKTITSNYYKKVAKDDHCIWKMNSLHYLYIFSIMTTASTFLSFTIFSSAISLVVSFVFLVLAIASVLLYFFVEKEKTRIKMPGAWNTLLNGIFVAILFYTVTLLIQINIIPLSFAVTLPVMLALIIIKRVIEKRFVIRMKRIAIVGLGLFLIVLSFPFTSSFNYISFYRGEFSFRIIYEQLDNPVKEFKEGVTGDVVFYDDYIIVVNEDITFYNDDLVKLSTMSNEYDYIYLMNGKLVANQVDISNPGAILLYEFNGTSFDLVGTYFGEVDDKIYLDESGTQYLPYNGYVYTDLNGPLERIINSGLEDYDELTKGEDFITFKYSRIIFGSSDSFMNDVDGYHYNNVAYHNDHMAFTYNTVFVGKYPSRINPIDDGKTVLYLVDEVEYMQNNAALQNSLEFPKLFRLNNFYYFDGHYYLVGHIEYVNGDKFGKIYVYDDEGNLNFEAIYDDENVAVNGDYIAYGEDTLRLYTVDSGTSMTYHLITGYGLMWFVMCMVALFAIKEIHLNPRRDLDYKKEEKAE